jgi:hypothetical protein
MMYQAGDLGLLIDFGNNLPGSVLQRRSYGQWQNYLIDGKPVLYPYDVHQLPPGEYRFK